MRGRAHAGARIETDYIPLTDSAPRFCRRDEDAPGRLRLLPHDFERGGGLVP